MNATGGTEGMAAFLQTPDFKAMQPIGFALDEVIARELRNCTQLRPEHTILARTGLGAHWGQVRGVLRRAGTVLGGCYG